MPEPTDTADPHGLQRFVDAQAGVIDTVRAELRAAAKRSHWMWFVFPQHVALGASATARRYGIRSRAEAAAYLRHPVLGPRLHECAGLLLMAPPGLSARDVLGPPDDLKLCSSMTLFEAVGGDAGFGAVLDRLCGGRRDARTLALIAPGDGVP